MGENLAKLILGLFLFVQILVYENQESEQRKDVRMPVKEEQVAEIPLTTAFPLEEKSEEFPVPIMEELLFTANPSAEYYRINPDYVGWLTVDGTIIDYPVVRGQDNDFYLEHNFYREPDILGAIFMDYRNIGMNFDRHTIIYGHYTQYGQMFRELENFLYEDFLLDNPEFTFENPHQERHYRIFSVHVGPPDPEFVKVHFEGDAYSDYLSTIQELSYYPLGVEVTAEDNIITLVSCNFSVDDGRLFVHAVEIAEE